MVPIVCRKGRLVESERVSVPVRSEIGYVCAVFNLQKSHVFKLGELVSFGYSANFAFVT